MSVLQSVPLWGYFIVLGLAFLGGHLLGLRPDPDLRPGRRMAGRWGSSLLLLASLLLVSPAHVATILPSVALAFAGGLVSGRTAPPATPKAGDPKTGPTPERGAPSSDGGSHDPTDAGAEPDDRA